MSDEQQPRESQDDLDSLFEAHQELGVEVPDELSEALGSAVEPLVPFAVHAREVLTIGLESVAGKSTTLQDAAFSVTDYEAIETEFAATPHVGFEVKLAVSETEAHLLVALVPVEDLGTMFSLEMTPEQMQDAAFAAGQMETVAGSLRELLDLVSLTLLGEHLEGVEATLSEKRFGQIDMTMGILADVSRGAPAIRLDLTLGLPEDQTAQVVLVVPQPLLQRIGALLGADEEADDPLTGGEGEPDERDVKEPTPIRPVTRAGASRAHADPGEAGGGFGLSEDIGDNAQRPAGMFGAATGDDVDVHPVRFPPLPEGGMPSSAPHSMDLIMDVSMRVTVELGRSSMTVEEVLSLGPGSVVELNKLAGEPVDILVNDQLIARGEVVVVDENFGVRVTEIVSPRRRAHAMGA